MKFCNVFSRISVFLDSSVFGDNDCTADWVKTNETIDADGIEISRKFLFQKDNDVKFSLFLDYSPPRFKVVSGISQMLPLLGINGKADSKSTILRAIWTYIKGKRLIDQQNPIQINCDEFLERAFGANRLIISDIQKKLMTMLSPADPFEVFHRISFDMQSDPSIFDISVEVPDPVPAGFNGWFERIAPYTEEVEEYNQRIRHIIERIQKHKRRLEFLQAFSQSPIDVIRMLIATQCRDLKLMSEWDALREAQTSSTYYTSNGEWVSEAVDRYLGEDSQI